MCVGEWSLGREKAKERGLTPFFFLGSPKDVGQSKKKGKFGGVSEGKEGEAH